MRLEQIEKGAAVGFQKNDLINSFDKMKDRIRDELKRTFNPEFLNRIDEVATFRTLSHEDITKIVDIEIVKINQTLKGKKFVYRIIRRSTFLGC